MGNRSPDICLGRQPILDRQRRVVGYELLFRGFDDQTAACIGDDGDATACVVSHAFGKFGIRSVVGSSQAYVNMDADWLLSGRTAKLSKEHVVLEILETVDISEPLVRRCRALKAKGYCCPR